MLKVVIFYFSGTGNTWWVSQQLAQAFRAKKAEVSVISIERVTPNEADLQIVDADLIGFGYPIYGSDLPQIMKDFIGHLSKVQAQPTFVYCTQWLWSGDGARVGASFLEPQGFKIKWGTHFLMPNNVCLPIPLLPFTNDKERMQGQLRRASRRVNQFVNAMIRGKQVRKGFNYFAQILGAFQRVPFRKGFAAMRDSISFDDIRCTRCKLCVQYCPVSNIEVEDGTLLTKGNCILCLRCYNFCPVSAVTFQGKKHNHKKGEPFRGPVEGFRPN